MPGSLNPLRSDKARMINVDEHTLGTARAQCSCGHDLHSVWVSPHPVRKKAKFWYGVFWGVSGGRPDRIVWKCRLCGDLLAESTDPVLLIRYRHE